MARAKAAARTSEPASPALSALMLAAASSRTIAAHRNLLAIAGGAAAGVFLAQLVYWTRRGTEVLARDGWVFKTGRQWQKETGLSPKVQRRARQALIRRGLIAERLAGCPARMEFRLNLNALHARVRERVELRLARAPLELPAFRNESAVVRELLGPIVSFNRRLADATASVEDALLLSRLIHRIVQAGPKAGGWHESSRAQWAEDTGLTRSEQETARRHLRHLGVLDEKFEGFPRKLLCRLNFDRAVELLTGGDDLAREGYVRRKMLHLGIVPPQCPSPASAAAQNGVPSGANAADLFAVEVTQSQASEEVKNQANSLTHIHKAGSGQTGDREFQSPVAPNPASLFVLTLPASSPEPCLLPNTRNLITRNFTTTTPLTPRFAPAGSVPASTIRVGVVFGEIGKDGKGARAQPPESPAAIAQQPVPADESSATVWPAWVSDTDRPAIAAWLKRVPDPQLVLDEADWCSRRKSVHSPVGLVRKLSQMASAGELVPEGAHRIAAERKRKADDARQHAERVAAEARPLNEEEIAAEAAAYAKFKEAMAQLKAKSANRQPASRGEANVR